MFYLRVINPDGSDFNTKLGDSYTVTQREVSYDSFRKIFKDVFGKPHVADLDSEADEYTKNVFAFISFDGGAKIELLKNQSYFIMTENGKTFSNESYR